MSDAPMQSDPRRGLPSSSKIYQLALCPPSHEAQKGIPEPPPSPEAAFGTHVHAWLAGEHIELRPEESECARSCADIFEKISSGLLIELEQVPTTLRHERLWLELKGKYLMSGETDRIDIYGSELVLITEYKTGRIGADEAPSNMQLRSLAVMAKQQFKPKRIVCLLIQPYATPHYTLTEYDDLALRVAYDELCTILDKAADPTQPRVAGAVQCKYCLAKGTCIEYQTWIASQVPALASAALPVGVWTREQWAQFLDVKGEVEKWMADRESEAKKLLGADPQAIAGWRLKPGHVRQTITDTQTCYDRAMTLGMSNTDFMTCVAVTKGKLEKAVANTTGYTGQKLKVEMTHLLEGITEQKQNAPSLERIK